MASEAIGQVLSYAVGVSLSPVPIIGVVLMLGTPRARANGPAFIAGWMLGLAAAGTIVLLAAGGADASQDSAPADWVKWLKLALGTLLLLVAVKQWRGRPAAGEDPALPKWMQAIDTYKTGKAAGLGVLLSAANPKNLLLVVGAAAAIAQTGASAGDQGLALAVFVLLGTVGPGLPVAFYLAMGERSKTTLDNLKAWMGAHNAAIVGVLCVVLGTKLVGDAISGF